MSVHQVLIAGQWRDADKTGTFRADNPATKEALPAEFPVSAWSDCDAALQAATEAAASLRAMSGEQVAAFLEDYANRIEQRADELVEMAHAETALPKAPRLADVELPRTTNQLRLGAAAARNGSWAQATIDTQTGIRACYGSIGPVCVFGPNNFPFAFGSISGGDFAAAIAAGNPVIAKANSSHPGTTRIFAEAAQEASLVTEMPAATVQLLYRTSHADGERLVADPRTGATGYTGSRNAGLKLKQAADAVGKPIYLELSSTNPVVILPGALEERLDAIADDFSGSCLMGAGQFCTNPGIVVLIAGERTRNSSPALPNGSRKRPSGLCCPGPWNRTCKVTCPPSEPPARKRSLVTTTAVARVIVARTHCCGRAARRFWKTPQRSNRSLRKRVVVCGRHRHRPGRADAGPFGRKSDRLHLFTYGRKGRRSIRPCRRAAPATCWQVAQR